MPASFDTKSPTGIVRDKVQLTPEYEAWKASPGPATLTPLVSSLDPVIRSSLQSYGIQNDPVMLNAARIHAGQVVGRYDPSRGASLDTFIRQEMQRMQRVNAKRSSAIPIPGGVMVELASLSKEEEELEHQLGRPPTTAELADKTGISARRIEKIRSTYKPVVTDRSGTPTGDDNVFMLASQEFDRDKFSRNLVYMDADAIDKKIMEWTFGMYGAPVLSKSEMASKLGISVPALTKRSSRLLGKIEEQKAYSVL